MKRGKKFVSEDARIKNIMRCRAWKAANREKVLAQQRAYSNANRETRRLAVAASHARFKAAHPEQYRAQLAAYRRANRDKFRAYDAKRRARQRASGDSYTEADIRTLLIKQRGRCPVCKALLSRGYHVDHVIPLISGGSNGRENIQLLCPPCNQTKGAKHPIAFMQERGFLL